MTHSDSPTLPPGDGTVGVAFGSALFGGLVMKRTNIIPASRRVLRRVITGALGAGGFVSGVKAHQQTCIDRILELDDSPLADELQIRDHRAEGRAPQAQAVRWGGSAYVCQRLRGPRSTVGICICISML